MKTRRSVLLAGLWCLASTMPLSGVQIPGQEVRLWRPDAAVERTLPPPALQLRDTVDALYSRARQEMAAGGHAQAAELFRRIADAYPDSRYAADALYWEAFNRYRLDDESSLRRALEALSLQARSYPAARSRRNGEAQALETRIRGRLASRGDETAARAIRDAAEQQTCDEQDLETRTAALNALVHVGPAEALPILRDVIGREDACGRELRKRVPYLLGQLESPEATALVMDLARSDVDPETRHRAISYLGRSGSDEAVDLLLEIARSDTDVEARERALSVLGRGQGGPGHIRMLMEAARSGVDFDGVRIVNLRRAGTDDPRVSELYREIATNPDEPLELREIAVDQLGRSGEAGVIDLLAGVFTSTPELREEIVPAVARVDDPAATEWLRTVALDASVDEDVRKDAINRLARREGGFGAYVELYADLESTELKQSFLMGLSRRDEPEAVDLLIREAREAEDPEVRRSAIYWLGRSGDPRAASVLREIIG